MTYSKAIEIRILSLCDQRDFTISHLARLSNLRQSTIEDILLGNTKNPTLKTLHKISRGFQMTVAEFLDFPEMKEEEFED